MNADELIKMNKLTVMVAELLIAGGQSFPKNYRLQRLLADAEILLAEVTGAKIGRGYPNIAQEILKELE